MAIYAEILDFWIVRKSLKSITNRGGDWISDKLAQIISSFTSKSLDLRPGNTVEKYTTFATSINLKYFI